MDIHKKFSNKEEYIAYFNELISWTNCTRSLWKPEDRPKLEPFFKVSAVRYETKIEWTEEIKESFDHYVKCCEDYANLNREIRDSVSQISEYVLAEAFFFNVIEPEDEDKPIYYELNEENLSFPLIVTGYIESGFDRFGKSSLCMIRIVTLKDFD